MDQIDDSDRELQQVLRQAERNLSKARDYADDYNKQQSVIHYTSIDRLVPSFQKQI